MRADVGEGKDTAEPTDQARAQEADQGQLTLTGISTEPLTLVMQQTYLNCKTICGFKLTCMAWQGDGGGGRE